MVPFGRVNTKSSAPTSGGRKFSDLSRIVKSLSKRVVQHETYQDVHAKSLVFKLDMDGVFRPCLIKKDGYRSFNYDYEVINFITSDITEHVYRQKNLEVPELLYELFPLKCITRRNERDYGKILFPANYKNSVKIPMSEMGKYKIERNQLLYAAVYYWKYGYFVPYYYRKNPILEPNDLIEWIVYGRRKSQGGGKIPTTGLSLTMENLTLWSKFLELDSRFFEILTKLVDCWSDDLKIKLFEKYTILDYGDSIKLRDSEDFVIHNSTVYGQPMSLALRISNLGQSFTRIAIRRINSFIEILNCDSDDQRKLKEVLKILKIFEELEEQ